MIRLQRTGRKNEPTFRVVLTDKRNGPKSNSFVELLGSYDPRKKDANFTVKPEQIKEWIAKGAKPSDTVHNLLMEAGIIAGKKINVLPQKSPVVDEEAVKKAEEEAAAKAEAEKAAAEAPVEEEEKAEDAPTEDAAPETDEAPAEEVKEEASAEEKTPPIAESADSSQGQAEPGSAPAEDDKKEE